MSEVTKISDNITLLTDVINQARKGLETQIVEVIKNHNDFSNEELQTMIDSFSDSKVNTLRTDLKLILIERKKNVQ